jgi:hypothetical protein
MYVIYTLLSMHEKADLAMISCGSVGEDGVISACEKPPCKCV